MNFSKKFLLIFLSFSFSCNSFLFCKGHINGMSYLYDDHLRGLGIAGNSERYDRMLALEKSLKLGRIAQYEKQQIDYLISYLDSTQNYKKKEAGKFFYLKKEQLDNDINNIKNKLNDSPTADLEMIYKMKVGEKESFDMYEKALGLEVEKIDKGTGSVLANDEIRLNNETALKFKFGEVNDDEIKKFKLKLNKNKDRYDQILKDAGVGDIIARGLGGDASKHMLKDIVIGDSVIEGIQVGLSSRASDSIGKELGKSIDTFVGRGFSSGAGWLIYFFSFLNNIIFHGGNFPFEIYEVEIWKTLVINDMRSMEKMLKNGGKDSSRSRDMIARETDEDDKEKDEEQIKLIWKDFSEAFAEQSMQIVEEINQRKKYYKKSDLIVFYSSQLQKRLLGLAELVLKLNSLKDFSTLGEVNTVFPSLKNNVEKLFVVLKEQIKMSKFSFDKNKKLSSSLGSSSSNDYTSYNDYPHSMGDY